MRSLTNWHVGADGAWGINKKRLAFRRSRLLEHVYSLNSRASLVDLVIARLELLVLESRQHNGERS